VCSSDLIAANESDARSAQSHKATRLLNGEQQYLAATNTNLPSPVQSSALKYPSLLDSQLLKPQICEDELQSTSHNVDSTWQGHAGELTDKQMDYFKVNNSDSDALCQNDTRHHTLTKATQEYNLSTSILKTNNSMLESDNCTQGVVDSRSSEHKMLHLDGHGYERCLVNGTEGFVKDTGLGSLYSSDTASGRSDSYAGGYGESVVGSSSGLLNTATITNEPIQEDQATCRTEMSSSGLDKSLLSSSPVKRFLSVNEELSYVNNVLSREQYLSKGNESLDSDLIQKELPQHLNHWSSATFTTNSLSPNINIDLRTDRLHESYDEMSLVTNSRSGYFANDGNMTTIGLRENSMEAVPSCTTSWFMGMTGSDIHASSQESLAYMMSPSADKYTPQSSKKKVSLLEYRKRRGQKSSSTDTAAPSNTATTAGTAVNESCTSDVDMTDDSSQQLLTSVLPITATDSTIIVERGESVPFLDKFRRPSTGSSVTWELCPTAAEQTLEKCRHRGADLKDMPSEDDVSQRRDTVDHHVVITSAKDYVNDSAEDGASSSVVDGNSSARDGELAPDETTAGCFQEGASCRSENKEMCSKISNEPEIASTVSCNEVCAKENSESVRNDEIGSLASNIHLDEVESENACIQNNSAVEESDECSNRLGRMNSISSSEEDNVQSCIAQDSQPVHSNPSSSHSDHVLEDTMSTKETEQSRQESTGMELSERMEQYDCTVDDKDKSNLVNSSDVVSHLELQASKTADSDSAPCNTEISSVTEQVSDVSLLNDCGLSDLTSSSDRNG